LILHARHLGVTICLENTTSEMGAPAYLRAFVDETRLTDLRFNFDIGHANLADGAEGDRIAESFAPLKDLVAGVHIHDNHGEKDEHLPPYDGSIDWESAVKLLKSAPGGENVPLTLELKEKVGPDGISTPEQLSSARKSVDRLEEEWG
jgi:sugar phosphate isomerase/epimerase